MRNARTRAFGADRAGKGDAQREVPLNSACRKALDDWSEARAASEVGALWLSRQSTRMSSRAIDLVIRRLAKDAGLVLSAHTLRHTAVTNLIRSGADVVLVAEIAGHRRRTPRGATACRPRPTAMARSKRSSLRSNPPRGRGSERG